MHFGILFFPKKLRDYVEIIGSSYFSDVNLGYFAETWRTKINVVGILQAFPGETTRRKKVLSTLKP